MWTMEIKSQECYEFNSVDCYLNNDENKLICRCNANNCNQFGDFHCCISSNFEFGKLVSFPINTKQCWTVRDYH